MQEDDKSIQPLNFLKFANHNLSIWQSIVGQRITDKKYGDGTILRVEPSFAIWVRFDESFISGLTNKLTNTLQLAPISFENGRVTRLSMPPYLLERIREVESQKKGQQQEKEQRCWATEAANIRKREEERGRKETERLAELRAVQTSRNEKRLDDEEKHRRLYVEYQERLRKDREQERITAEPLRKAEQQRQWKYIKPFCLKREITNLVHFTRIQNLYSILEQGVLSREKLENLPQTQKPIFNDEKRYDNCRKAVNLSISFPNYQVFYKFSIIDRAEWVILLLKSDILWEFDCAFCNENAAANAVTEIQLLKRTQYKALVQMFEDQIKRQNLGIPDNYTTNPQAEVLVLGTINPSYITEVHFYDRAAMQKWQNENKVFYTQKLVVNRTYFVPRQDWRAWSIGNEKPTPPSNV